VGPLLPTILFFIFFTIIAPFFSYFTYLFSLSSFFLFAILLEVFKPFPFVFSLSAFRLLFDELVFSIFFLLLFDVSTRVLIEDVIELPRVDILLEFLEEAELDFFSLLFSWEVE
jgi:hypothetical protein